MELSSLLGSDFLFQPSSTNLIDQAKAFLRSLNLRKQGIEADVFAAYFLLPEKGLNAVLKED